jgi:hypothetical protein
MQAMECEQKRKLAKDNGMHTYMSWRSTTNDTIWISQSKKPNRSETTVSFGYTGSNMSLKVVPMPTNHANLALLIAAISGQTVRANVHVLCHNDW